ncbi:hypothetical protein GGR58DRAFT_499846 [Xylaria digitata]|nr:hypothetical protein GGR58DRAFT_499846 [Xylaria digitata]
MGTTSPIWLDEAFRTAKQDFINGLKTPSRYDFSKLQTIDDFYNAAEDIQRQQAKTKTLRALKKIEPFIMGMNDYLGTIDTFVQAKAGILALIWVNRPTPEIHGLLLTHARFPRIGPPQATTTDGKPSSHGLREHPTSETVLDRRTLDGDLVFEYAATEWLEHIKACSFDEDFNRLPNVLSGLFKTRKITATRMPAVSNNISSAFEGFRHHLDVRNYPINADKQIGKARHGLLEDDDGLAHTITRTPKITNVALQDECRGLLPFSRPCENG